MNTGERRGKPDGWDWNEEEKEVIDTKGKEMANETTIFGIKERTRRLSTVDWHLDRDAVGIYQTNWV